MPGHSASVYTCGFTILNDPDFRNSRCILIWGLDVESSYRGIHHRNIKQAMAEGAKLIVVDPRKIKLAEKADVWLQVRPGTDCALGLGMINVIINEELYDRDFIENWTTGFEKLKNHVKDYSPERVAEITWVPEEKIIAAARIYAGNSPAAVGAGTGGLCQNTNSFQTNRTLAILASLTGNLDSAGGNVNHALILKDKATMASIYDAPFGVLSREQIKKRLSVGRVVRNDAMLLAHPEALWPAIREGKPYPVKAMLGVGQNPVVSRENSVFVRDTLMKLEFFAVMDLFMNPTADLADIVLPVAHWAERDEIIDAYTKNYIFCHKKIVEAPDDCREDKKILVELAEKLGMKEYWKSVEECLDDRLVRLNMKFKEFKEKGMVKVPIKYKKHEKFGGFKTPTKKVEFYSERLKKMGSDPLPVFREPPESPVSTPELAKDYPLILLTGRKTIGYLHSAYRNIPRLRKLSPEPVLEIHPDAAKERGIADGDWIEIETKRGMIKHKARVSEKINSRVVTASHGWWYGYENGWREVNINVLTDGKVIDPDVGSGAMKGLLCQVRKAEVPPVEI